MHGLPVSWELRRRWGWPVGSALLLAAARPAFPQALPPLRAQIEDHIKAYIVVSECSMRIPLLGFRLGRVATEGRAGLRTGQPGRRTPVQIFQGG